MLEWKQMKEAAALTVSSTHYFTKKSLARQLFACIWKAVSTVSVEKLK